MTDRPPEPDTGTGRGPSSGDAPELIDRIAAAYAAQTDGEDTTGTGLVGRVIGSYRLLRRLSRGGMGDVYLGERADGAYEGSVAVKVLRTGVDADTLAARFRRERQILARLDHPHIARLLDGGSTGDGIPYLVMELIDGESLVAFADRRGLDLDARLELFAAVCEAVAYAHRNLVVHRDLKPANILVAADGAVKLLDFGIGKLLEDDGDADAALTRTGLLPMTPAYAAPEQVLGEPVTTATDVYALGVVLYELLTGSRPHERDTRPLTALAGAVETEVTLRPSEALRRRGGEPRTQRTARALRGDLDTIVLTALQRRPERRYPSADALAEDLRRYREGQPIRARPDTAGYRARKFLGRHRVGVLAAALVVLALACGLAAALWQASEAREEARRAAAVQAFLVDIFRANTSRQPDPVRARETTARELLDLGAARIDTALEVAPATKLTMTRLLGELYHELAVDEEAVRLRSEAVELARRIHGAPSVELAAALVDLADSLHASTRVDRRQAVLEEAAGILDRLDAPALRRRLVVQQAQHALSSDLPAALDHAERAVALHGRSGPSEGFAEALYIQGVARYLSGSDRRAVASLRRAVEVSRAAQGFPNPAIPRYYTWLGDIQFRLLDIRSAEESHRQALIAAREVNGEAHVDTLQTTMRLGRLLCGTGRVDEGLELLRRARDLALETRGARDPFHTPQALLEHGFCLARGGRLGDGLEEMEAALADWRQSRPGTVYIAHVLESVADTLVETGRDDRAETMLDEAARVREEAGQARRTPNWNFHVATRIRLSLSRGRVGAAEELLDAFVVEGDPTEAPSSLSRIARELLAAEVRQAAGDDAAVEPAREVKRTIETAGLEEHLGLELASAHLVLGRTALRQGRPREARPWLERALDVRAATLLPQGVEIAEAQIALAECLLELGRAGEARRLAERARTIHAAHERVAEHYVEALRSVASRL